MRTQQEQAAIERGLRWLVARQNADGSFGEQLLNYTTSVAVGALARWDDPAVKPALAKAQRFLLACQFLESNGYQSSDRDYGAMGYGGNDSRRADLSNTNFALQALRDTGLPENNEAFQKAIVFLQRTQNLQSVNDFKGKVPDPENNGRKLEATPGNNGGACYYPGNSSAGYIVLPDGKAEPRSYGSMTYALIKAYSLCGLKADDARVQAAVKWIQANWTLAENPGIDPALGEKARFQGLFYYYMVLAQALDLVGVREVTATGKDGKPETVDWRKALRAHLETLQAANGTWVNGKNERWMEGRDFLCTCYALIALEHCR
jgi:squalene-hopene/tetraprenyl-beta-curcumene cyclase